MFESEIRTIKIDGMKCAGCAKRITDRLTRIKGVKKAEINLADKECRIECSKKVSDDTIAEAVSDLGFSVIR